MSWKQTVDERQELVLATSSLDGVPNAIVVISMGYVDDRILIGVCQMKKTIENITKNNKVVVIAKKDGEYYRIKGTAEIHSSGKYFDLVYSKSNPPMPKSVLMITINEIFDLDKQQVISH